ncbi:hypothetical protein [Mycobacterium uberis]|uniref:hypothetical protein n=1 Tax=Mycobacterium uberis TaxID=2162698 RepID=UPI001FB5320F|nr:hypothetical protein [Mycobacterium uberis]
MVRSPKVIALSSSLKFSTEPMVPLSHVVLKRLVSGSIETAVEELRKRVLQVKVR